MKFVEVPQDILSYSKASSLVGAEMAGLTGGNIQTNYRINTGSVLHISPIFRELTPLESVACNKWWVESKATKLELVQNRQANSHGRIEIPKISDTGEIAHPAGKFPFWVEDYLVGIPLKEAIFSGFNQEAYQSILEWTAKFHSVNETSVPLKQFYDRRLKVFIKLFEEDYKLHNYLGDSSCEKITSLINTLISGLNVSVADHERVSQIHGDLRDTNIIVGDEKIGIIDFEQGLDGGDWYADLFKLISPHEIAQPDATRPYLNRAPLTLSQKSQLVKSYVGLRTNMGWEGPQFILDYCNSENTNFLKDRTDLIRADMLISTLIYRNVQGWTFATEGNRRGVGFIAELIKDLYFLN